LFEDLLKHIFLERFLSKESENQCSRFLMCIWWPQRSKLKMAAKIRFIWYIWLNSIFLDKNKKWKTSAHHSEWTCRTLWRNIEKWQRYTNFKFHLIFSIYTVISPFGVFQGFLTHFSHIIPNAYIKRLKAVDICLTLCSDINLNQWNSTFGLQLKICITLPFFYIFLWNLVCILRIVCWSFSLFDLIQKR